MHNLFYIIYKKLFRIKSHIEIIEEDNSNLIRFGDLYQGDWFYKNRHFCQVVTRTKQCYSVLNPNSALFSRTGKISLDSFNYKDLVVPIKCKYSFTTNNLLSTNKSDFSEFLTEFYMPSLFECLNNNQPFWHCRLKCFGIVVPYKRNPVNYSMPNSLLIFSDDSLRTETMRACEAVVPINKVIVKKL
jgi:hypothetical protein